MSRQYWVAPVGPLAVGPDVAQNTFTTLKDITIVPQITLPANSLEVGSELELQASGEFSTTGTPTLLLGYYYGGASGGVALAASGAITTGSAAAAWPWIMRWRGIVRSVGTSGTIKGEGELHLGTALTTFALSAIPITQALRTITIDTTAAKTLTVGAAWGTSSASNSVTCYDISAKLVT
jgi:hypothetical protein